MSQDDAIAALNRALHQLEDLVGQVGPSDLDRPTPCEEWTVSGLLGHLASCLDKLAVTVNGGEADWTTATEPDDDLVAGVLEAAEHLRTAWLEPDPSAAPEWQCAEVSVHTFDLATGLDRSTAELDPEPAELGLAFMRAHLEDEMRGEAFGPEQPAPEDADAYQRIAAFAGREV